MHSKVLAKSRVLFVTPHLPTRFGGGAFATCSMMQALSDIFKEQLTILGPTGIAEAELDAAPCATIQVPLRTGVNKVCDLLGRRSIDRIGAFFLRHAVKLIQDHDLIVVDKGGTHTAPAVVEKLGKQAVVIHHNIEADYFGTQVKTLADRLRASAVERLERHAFRAATLNLTLSEEDREGLLQRYGTGAEHCDVLGGFERKQVELPDLAPDITGPWPTLVATGSLNSNQTVDGITRFAKESWPAIQAAFPQSRLLVAGKKPSRDLCALLKSVGAEVIANPPDMSPVLAQGHAYVAPVRLGSGMKYRVMDALRFGLPALCHPVSAHGYSSLVGTGAVHVCMNANDYVAAITSLNSRPSYESRQQVQAAYWARYSYTSGVERLRRAFEPLVPGMHGGDE